MGCCCGFKKKDEGPKKGDKLVCKSCGATVIVEKVCDCGPDCKITCCDKPMSVC